MKFDREKKSKQHRINLEQIIQFGRAAQSSVSETSLKNKASDISPSKLPLSTG